MRGFKELVHVKEAGLQDEFKLNLKSLYCFVTNGEDEEAR